MNERQSGPQRIQALARADAILDALGLAGGWARLTDVSRETGLKKTTTFNLLDSLVSLGFAERDTVAGRYRLGLRNLELGRLVQRRLNIVLMSEPVLIRLCADTRETVNLAVPHLYEVLITNSLEGKQGVRVTSYAGTRASFHSTACGKAMLAHMPDRFFNELLRRSPLRPVTPHTITNVDQLSAELQKIRAMGYAVEQQENEIGAACVACVIHDGFGSVAGAISVAGPVARMTPDTISRIGKVLMRETTAASRRLGVVDDAAALARTRA
ncbi:MAG: IclR family transcriptional regulator [Variovorax sp.]